MATPVRDVYDGSELEEQGHALSVISKAEIDQQIATAHAYPRSIERFRTKGMSMLTLNQETAIECFYTLPRAGKKIQGPSVRLSEIIAASYGNLRAGGRVTDESRDFVTAQGVCHDLENNLAITFEVKRRIIDSNGKRYNIDMIGTTGNAAVSIALRNAILRVVPKALWLPLYNKALEIARGDEKTLEFRREACLIAFEKLKVSRKQVFEFLGVNGPNDIGLDQLLELIGLGNAIKNGESSIEEVSLKESEIGEPRRASETKKAAEPEAPRAKAKSEEPEKKPESSAVDSADLKRIWECGFAKGMAKVDINALAKKRFNVDKVQELKKNQAEELLREIAAL
jgi:hypothetical protein